MSNSGTSSAIKGAGTVYTTNTITKTLTAGSSGPVLLSLSGLPIGVSYMVSNSSCAPTCQSVITFGVSSSAPNGNSTITVTGSPLSKTTQFTLSISSSNFQVTCYANPDEVTLGTAIAWTAQPIGGVPPYTYVWSGPNVPTAPAPTSNPYNKTYTTIGTKTAQVTVTDATASQSTCPQASATVTFDPRFEEF